MSDFRFQPWPGTIAITTLLEFCSWLLTFAVEVARNTSINKAAEWLYTSQSNVSNSIKALEDELGTFTSLPLNENDSNILTHYYILQKDAKHHPLTYLYIEELKKCLVPFKIGATVQVAFRHVGSKI